MRRKPILAALLFLTACSAQPVANNAVVVADDSPAKPFIPLTAAEIREALPGHYIDQGVRYDCMNAPILILKDGTFDTMTEVSGRTSGNYTITDGTIEFDDQGGPEHFLVTIKLFRDQKGRLYYRHQFQSEDPRPVVLKPADPKMIDDLCRDAAAANASAPKP